MQTTVAKQLTGKERRFVVEYCVDWNGTAAARRAGYSENSANRIASKMLKKEHILAAIEQEIKDRCKRTGINSDWVLLQLAEEKNADFADLFDDNGNLLDVKQWPRVWRTGLIESIECFEEYQGRGAEREAIGMVRKIKITSRIKHLELIGKHVDVRAFREQIGLSDPKGKPLAPPVFNLSFDDGGPGQ